MSNLKTGKKKELVRKPSPHYLLFLFNFQPEAQTFSLYDLAGTEMVTGERIAGTLTMPAFGSRVVKLD